jgi:perosamine synthetase
MSLKVRAFRRSIPDDERELIVATIDDCLLRGQFAPGEHVETFENTFARFVGRRHAVALSSGGSALEVAMRAMNVAGHEVLLPTNTFLATHVAILAAGGIPKLIDIDVTTASPSVAQVEGAIGPNTRGVVIVHIGGIISPHIEQIAAVCKQHGLWLFEDCAHAHGSSLAGIMAGGFGIGGAYSFCSTKIVTCGEGGMLVTDDPEFASKARLLRNYGKPEPWVTVSVEFGMNWRLNELAAIVGSSQVRCLDRILTRRSAIASRYTALLSELDSFRHLEPVGTSSWYKYIVLLPRHLSRDVVRRHLREGGIEIPGGVYDVPLHKQPVLTQTGFQDFPESDDFSARHLCLPMYPELTEQEITYVAEQLKECWR